MVKPSCWAVAERDGFHINAFESNACLARKRTNSHQWLVSAPWVPSSSRKMRIVGWK
jgi:hypothetical protein